MKTLGILGLGVLLAATAGIAWAHEKGAMREAVTAVFTEADADGSSDLTPAEFQTFHELLRERMRAHRFQRADADDSGAVTLDELEEARPRRRHGRRGPGF